MLKQIPVILNKKLANSLMRSPNVNFKYLARLEGCKKEDIQRYVSGL